MKERVADIVCKDGTRVKLKDGEGSDYIHASYVKLYSSRQAICTQAPKEDTAVDFWRMAWQEGSGMVVMLCNFVRPPLPLPLLLITSFV